MSNKNISCLTIIFLFPSTAFCQGFLGMVRDSIIHAHTNCAVMDKYQAMMVLNCSGRKSIFYFSGADSTCDMYAMDISKESANDTLKTILEAGFKQASTKYVEPFLVSKHSSNHQKFPSRIYTNGKIQYCLMPISLNGKTAEMNSLIIMYKKK